MGFFKTMPSNAIGFYGSGTGMAGITGALIFIALEPIMSDQAIYLLAAPTAIPYVLCFRWVLSQKKKYPYVPEENENNAFEEEE